ncbi:MAG TPA: DUF2066 domain-containing protein [Hypericibacter adhaerens]|uniref:DUF2066 domain-containing protein n=1 Tax=Hypericibacter adhaerens TaxID=2602016 RepID=A0A5J6N0X9_9PROT|nr:DUF2066 domain-containing protein [Hypericibacter adhaerens]QEX23137.1 hypothetical protein FRZ61_30720 [Hypericibacter adhaerens]HWA45035.1 DUF2066 domain-containing protein [Hypericibacter adhaerens]
MALVFLLGIPGLAWAQGVGPSSYTVGGVDVDVTADSAAAARDAAIVLGQRIAFDKLIALLVDPQSAGSVPRLSDAQLSDLVSDFEVESERASSVRYIGKLSYRFRGDSVRALLEQNGVRYAVMPTSPILVVPVLEADGQTLLWDPQNAWLSAWAADGGSNTLVPLKIPSGDELDAGMIDAAAAEAGDTAKLGTLAQRHGASQSLVVVAKLSADAATDTRRLDITGSRYGLSGLVGSFTDQVSVTGSALDQLYAAGVEKAETLLQDALRQENLVVSGVEQRLSVTVPIDSYAAWIDIRKRLAGVPILKRAEIRNLTTKSAALDLVYVGDETQLQTALGERRLTLASNGDQRLLVSTSAGSGTGSGAGSTSGAGSSTTP